MAAQLVWVPVGPLGLPAVFQMRRDFFGEGINCICEVLHGLLVTAVVGPIRERESFLNQPSSSKELVVGRDVIACELLLYEIACGLY